MSIDYSINTQVDPNTAPLKPFLQEFDHGFPDQLARLSELIRVPLDALEKADEQGFLIFNANWHEMEVFGTADPGGAICQLRRLDGTPFPPFGPLRERPSHTLRGSQGSFPIGFDKAALNSQIAVVLDVVDLLTSFAPHNGLEPYSVTAILAEKPQLGQNFLQLFENKTVRIFPPIDPKGNAYVTAARLQRQLQKAGALCCDIYDFGALQKFGGDVASFNDFFHWKTSTTFPEEASIANQIRLGWADESSPCIVDSIRDLHLVREGHIKLPPFYMKQPSAASSENPPQVESKPL